MNSLKAVFIIAVTVVVAFSVFVRAATFAQRNLPVFPTAVRSVLVTANDSANSQAGLVGAPLSPQNQPIKRGPVSLEKVFVRFARVSQTPLSDTCHFHALPTQALISAAGSTPSRPPSA
jgi:hypothetical protein